MNLSGDIGLRKELRATAVFPLFLTLLRPLLGDDTRFSLERGTGVRTGWALGFDND